LEIHVTVNCFGKQSAGVKWRAVRCISHTDFALRNDCDFGKRDAKQIRMDRPKSRRQGAKLYSFDASLFDKSNRVLKIIVGVLCAIRRKNAPRRHWLTVY